MTERGSASVLAAAVVAVVVLLGLGAAGAGGLAVVKVRTQTAADAAALAAAPATFHGPDPRTVAARYAAANGAALHSCRCRVDRSTTPRRVVVEAVTVIEVPVLGTYRVLARADAEYTPPRVEYIFPTS